MKWIDPDSEDRNCYINDADGSLSVCLNSLIYFLDRMGLQIYHIHLHPKMDMLYSHSVSSPIILSLVSTITYSICDVILLG